MMRSGLAALGALLLLAAPAAAQPGESARMERAALESVRWTERLNAALSAGSEGLDELGQRVQPLLDSQLTREQVAAVAPELRRLIERNRENVRRSDAMLAAMPAFKDMPTIISSEPLVAEARRQNALLMDPLNHYEALVVAMAAGDMAGANKVRPKLLEAMLALLGQQRLKYRNRQASITATDSLHQVNGIGVQMYRAMIAVARPGLAVLEGERAGAAAAAAALRGEMALVASDARALAAAGRSNLKRERAEFDALRKSSSNDGARPRLRERALAATLLEEKSFEIGDRLAAFADSKAALTVAQLLEVSLRALFMPLTMLEADFEAASAEQIAALGDSPKQEAQRRT